MLGFAAAGVLGVAFLAAWIALFTRLSQGPLDIGFLADRLESSINSRWDGFSFDIATAHLVWTDRLSPIEIELKDVHIIRADGTEVFNVDKMGVLLSKRHLLLGRLMPRKVSVYAPAMRVVRWEDGHFSLNLDTAPDPVFGPPLSPDMETAENERQVEFIRGLLGQLRDRTGFAALLGGLREINVHNAALLYEDRVLGVTLTSQDTDLSIARRRTGLSASAHIALGFGDEGNVNLRASLSHVWQTGHTGAVVIFDSLDPAVVLRGSEKMAALADVKVPLKGSVSFTLDKDFRPDGARFVLGADAGTFAGFGLYPPEKPLQVASLYMAGYADVRTLTGRLDQFRLDIGGPRIEASGAAVRDDAGDVSLTLDASLTDTEMDKLAGYWPESLAPDARDWVVTHLSAGTAHKATLSATALYRPDAETEKFAIRRLGGDIAFSGIKVDYFPPMTAAEKAEGRAFYDMSSFNIDVSSGVLRDMKIGKSTIRITGLDTQDDENHAHIDIAAAVSGPLKTALQVLDAKPLEYPKMLGIAPDAVEGDAAVDVTFSFPLHKALDLPEVAVTAQATIDNARLPDMVAGMDITGGPMALGVDSGALSVKGRARLGGMPLDFDWVRHFNDNAAFDSKVTASLPLDAQSLYAFGVPKALALQGTMPAKVTYTVARDGTGALSLAGDVTPLSFALPEAGVEKSAGTAGTLSLNIAMENDKPRKISGLALEAAGIVVKGDIDFDAAGDMRRAVLPVVVAGRTDVAVEAENLGAEGYSVKVKGRQLDITSYWSADDKPNSDDDAAQKTEPFRLMLELDRLVLGENRSIDRARLFMHRNAWQRMEQLELDGNTAGHDLYLRYMPQGGGHSLRLEAANAGSALATLGLTKSIRGGRLVVTAEPSGGQGRDMKGTAVLGDFALKDAPAIARLLNALSLSGMINLLGGDGIEFKRARVNFEWIDRGQPHQRQNIRLLRLTDGRTSGASLGLTFEGEVDNWRRMYDINGTVIPVSDLNRLLGIIPLVGDVLTAGGEGIFGATYSIKGPQSDPTVSVNPLAVLAPGILRKVFFPD